MGATAAQGPWILGAFVKLPFEESHCNSLVKSMGAFEATTSALCQIMWPALIFRCFFMCSHHANGSCADHTFIVKCYTWMDILPMHSDLYPADWTSASLRSELCLTDKSHLYVMSYHVTITHTYFLLFFSRPF